MSAPPPGPADSRPAPLPLWPRVRSAARAVVQPLVPVAHVLAGYPLLLVVPAVIYLVAWDQLMSEYDAFHQLWSENVLVGALAGALTATVLGEVVLAVYLLDQDRLKRWEEDHPAAAAAPGPAAGRSSAVVRRVLRPAGRGVRWAWDAVRRPRAPVVPPPEAYWRCWTLLILLAVAPPFLFFDREFEAADPDARATVENARYWFPLGAAAAAVGLRVARLGTRRLAGWWPRAFRWLEKPEGFGVAVVGVFVVAYGGMITAQGMGDPVGKYYCPWFPAPVSLLMLGGLVVGASAAVSCYAGRVPVVYPGLIALFVVPFLIPSCQTHHHLPHLDVAGEGGATYYDEPARLAEYDRRRPAAHADDPGWVDPAGLVPTDEALTNWDARMQAAYGRPQPAVVVTVSGGASASALYVADVLFTLEEQFPGFADRVRLISGASGGMLGAAYFVTQLRAGGLIHAARRGAESRAYVAAAAEHAAATAGYRAVMARVRDEFLGGLRQDFLGPIVQKWAHRDLPLAARWWATANDRGQALEQAWSRFLRGALDVPVADLRDDERHGRIPSLVFTPMMIEDGRQLLVSNLDLDAMVTTDPAVGDGKVRSYMGAEFFRLFPRATRFRLSTAVRMNASFPFFSPPAALPTDPIRHVVDAGYYDNYGTTVALKWLARYSDWWKDRRRGWRESPALHRDTAWARLLEDRLTPPREVLLVRIRCWGNELASQRITTDREVVEYARGRDEGPPADPARRQEWVNNQVDGWRGGPPGGAPVRTYSGMYSVTAPLFGLFSAWRANMVYRGDERTAAAQELLRTAEGEQLRLVEYQVECQANPSLNWVLAANDLANIRADVRRNLWQPAAGANFLQDRLLESDLSEAERAAFADLKRPGAAAEPVPPPPPPVGKTTPIQADIRAGGTVNLPPSVVAGVKKQENYKQSTAGGQKTLTAQARLVNDASRLPLPPPGWPTDPPPAAPGG